MDLKHQHIKKVRAKTASNITAHREVNSWGVTVRDRINENLRSKTGVLHIVDHMAKLK